MDYFELKLWSAQRSKEFALKWLFDDGEFSKDTFIKVYHQLIWNSLKWIVIKRSNLHLLMQGYNMNNL